MELTEYIQHPEQLDRNSLYELRSLLALHPSYQTARLLMLQNLFLLHDPTFDEELRRAAIYITDRKVLFQLVEAAHYQIEVPKTKKTAPKPREEKGDRTISLIDNFLDSIPKESAEETANKSRVPKRKPTPADAAIDYVAYLLETEENDEEKPKVTETPQLIGHSLIDTFIENDKGKIKLNENPTLKPEIDEDNTSANGKEGDESFFTETLARIYIKQGRYSKALEIISRLSLQYPKKNAYFADQIRFLQKLIVNDNKK